MKRHKALMPLSREHHEGLILAQLLKSSVPDYKGMPTEPADKVNYALELFHTLLQPHFRKEEELLQRLKPANKEIADIIREIFGEHNQLEKDFMSLGNQADLPHALDNLGHKLEQHIRKEERQLFPLIQEHYPDKLEAML